ncbi:hypothetical protein L596_010984 [Steinernema carpocapsae]|uniref:Uncharacterized protein n=1 Tax=Steinernema carpocapsae TaxID=34508 RepID=A0A4U5NT96_STECR|nr:hypothetical protein L596_010984 [Steinernema carpocapsae]
MIGLSMQGSNYGMGIPTATLNNEGQMIFCRDLLCRCCYAGIFKWANRRRASQMLPINDSNRADPSRNPSIQEVFVESERRELLLTRTRLHRVKLVKFGNGHHATLVWRLVLVAASRRIVIGNGTIYHCG